MPLTIDVKSVLAYYDGPDVISGLDNFGNHYLGLAQEPSNFSFKFLFVRVSSVQASQLYRGNSDLRNIFDESSQFGWYECETDNLEAPIPLDKRINDPIPENLLPADDYFLVDSTQNGNAAMDEASSRQNST